MGETTYQAGASYTVSGNADFVASYTENTTPTPGGITANLNIEAYADANNWVNGTKYATATVTPVTFTANGGGNTGKYYTSGEEWRFYQTESASITISVSEGYTLVSVKPTYNVTSGGVLKNGNSTIASGSTVAVSGTSVTFTVGNSGTATNGQVKFTNIDVVYVSDGSTQTTSDLAITNPSTDLTFDLYDNTTAQVISYTTSSTGAITITPAESAYFSYVHDAAAKTITVTPTAVTPSAQTVTISQAADDDYYAGTATFTVSITDGAPLANIAALTAQTVASTYNVALSDAVVTYVNGNYAYIQDASGAVVYYKSGHGLTAGDVLNGTATVVYQLRNSNPQVTNLTGVTPVSGTAPNPTEVSASAWNYTFNNVLSQYFKITGATITQNNNKFYISLNNESIQLYKVGTAISGLDLTKTYSITGFPTLYNTTKELQIFVDPEVEVGTEPTVTVTPATVNAAYAGGDGTLAITYENIEELISFDYYFCDANGGELDEDPDWIDVEIQEENDTYSVYYVIDANDSEARSAYFKVYTFAGDELEEVYAIVTVNQAQFEIDYATLPFAFDDGKAEIETTNGLTQQGLGNDYNTSPKLRFDNTGDCLILKINERPGNLSYDIKGNSFSGGTFKVQVSADGVTYTDFITYTDLPNTNEGSQHESINHLGEDVRYIKWVYTTKVSGNVALGNIALEVYEAPQAYTLSIANDDKVTFLTQGITNGGSVEVYSGTQVTLEVRVTPGYILDEVIVLDGNGQQVTLTQVSEGYWSFYMPDSDVMVSADMVVAHAPVYYNLASTIQSGKRYIIVGMNNGVYYGMGVQRTNASNTQTNRAAKPITVDGTTASVTRSDVFDFTITLESDGTYSIYDEEAEGYLYVPNGSNNYIGTSSELGENGKWTIDFDSETGAAIVVANNKTMQYNTSNKLFSCYASGNQSAIYLYKIDDEFTFDIIGYTGVNDHYYLIASPVTVDPATVEGMTTGDFDLYYYDANQAKEWINWKGDESLGYAGGFSLEPGKGYLYAKKATSDHPTYSFGLSGELYDGDGSIELVSGWNLVGNPFIQQAGPDMDYYIMNEGGTGLIPGETFVVEPMEGIFVYGDVDDAPYITFSRIEPDAKNAGLSLNLIEGVSTSHDIIDRVIVRFGEGRQLPKVQLNEAHTKLFVTQSDKDYAVVRSASEGEMPVSFKANESGTYTLGMNAVEVSFDYLHLIDNMTGADVDLLATPTYTFEAAPSDYACRFKLVFKAGTGIEENNATETFAYFNGSSWTVSNRGEATLQVVDLMGRVLSSETINGNATVNINQTAGLYMLRLVNADNVKVQKVVVR